MSERVIQPECKNISQYDIESITHWTQLVSKTTTKTKIWQEWTIMTYNQSSQYKHKQTYKTEQRLSFKDGGPYSVTTSSNTCTEQ